MRLLFKTQDIVRDAELDREKSGMRMLFKIQGRRRAGGGAGGGVSDGRCAVAGIVPSVRISHCEFPIHHLCQLRIGGGRGRDGERARSRSRGGDVRSRNLLGSGGHWRNLAENLA